MSDHKLQSLQRAGIPRARARFLTQSMQLEEKELPGVATAGILLTAALLVGGVVWARVTPVAEVAHTAGAIIPAGRVHQVQHLEGGIVQAIHVSNGDNVDEGDVLVELRTTAAASELAQVQARKVALEARLRRVEALLADLDQAQFETTVEPGSLALQLFVEQRRSYAEQLELIETQRRQREQEMRSKQVQAQALTEEVAYIREQTAIHESVDSRAVIPRVKVLDARARLARAVSQLRDVQSEIEVARAGIGEAEQKKNEFISRWREERRLEAEAAANELAEVIEETARYDDRLTRMRITAPVTGVVQAMQVNTLNSVLEPGQVILELVPVEDELVAETRVLPRDIGHVQPGQRVSVKVSSFESQRFGTIDGSLRFVSATTYLDQDQQPYYKAEILLAKNFVGDIPGINRLVPGMTVEADIRTGEKSVLDYILKPVYRGFSGAMRER